MAAPTILVADDEKNIVQLIQLYLTNEGYQVEVAYNGLEALEKAKDRHPNLVVLDLMMPELDGWEVCRRLRRECDIPIIILTARGEDVDKIVGLELGADDYMAKPFNPRELVARIKAVLRRYEAAAKPKEVLALGDLRIDVAKREAMVGDRPIDLRAKEFDLLTAFAQNPGVVLNRERLLNLVWGYDFYGDSRTIDVHVTWLREKLGHSSAHIQTVRGIGYKLVVGNKGSKGIQGD